MLASTIVSAASFGVISAASIALYNQTNNMQNELNTKMKSVIDQVNTAQSYDYQIEKKQQESIMSLTSNTADMRNNFLTKDQLKQHTDTNQLNANNINNTGHMQTSGSIQFNSPLSGASLNPDYTIQRGSADLNKNRLVIKSPNEIGAGIDFSTSSDVTNMSIDGQTGQVNINNLSLGNYNIKPDNTWLNFFDINNNGGISTANTYTRDESYMNNAFVNNLTSLGQGDINWITAKRNEGDLKFGADSKKRGIWSDGNRPVSIFTNGEQQFSVDGDGNTNIYGNLNMQKPLNAQKQIIINSNNSRLRLSSELNGKIQADNMMQNSLVSTPLQLNPEGGQVQIGKDGLYVGGSINPKGGIYGPISTSNVQTNAMQLGNKWKLSGTGDSIANDNWLRLTNSEGTNYNGGIATANIYSRDNAYMNAAQVNALTSVGQEDNNWITVNRADGNLKFGATSTNRGLWSDGARDTSIYTNGTAKLTIKQDGTVNIPGTLNAGIVNTQTFSAPANNYISTDKSDGTNWFTIQRGDGNIQFGTDGQNNRGIVNSGVKNFNIYNGGASRLSITNQGNIGIGTDTPQMNLHVPGTTQLGNSFLNHTDGNTYIRAKDNTKNIFIGDDLANQISIGHGSFMPYIDGNTYIRPGANGKNIMIGDQWANIIQLGSSNSSGAPTNNVNVVGSLISNSNLCIGSTCINETMLKSLINVQTLPTNSILSPQHITPLTILLGHTFYPNLLYKGTVNGFAASTFHSMCDNKGPTLTVIKANNYISGGYNSVSWNQSSGWVTIPAGLNWLFTLQNPSGQIIPNKFYNTQNIGYSTFNTSSYGPTFGAGHDLYIYNNANSTNGNYSATNSTYTGSGLTNTTLFGAYNFTVTDIEVYST
jgi:hypothetical protein